MLVLNPVGYEKPGLSSMGVRIRGRGREGGREGKGFLVRLWTDGIAQMNECGANMGEF